MAWVRTNTIATGATDTFGEDAYYVSRCREGDDTAMRILIGRHRKRLVRIAANSLRDAHEAEDVVQDTFLKAFRELPRLREDRAFSGYLYRICVRLCMDRLRSRRPEPGLVDRAVNAEGSSVETKVLVSKLQGVGQQAPAAPDSGFTPHARSPRNGATELRRNCRNYGCAYWNRP